jgi:hypothetical protein
MSSAELAGIVPHGSASRFATRVDVQGRPTHVRVDHQGLALALGQRHREIRQHRRLALLGPGAGHEYDAPRLVDVTEAQVRAERAEDLSLERSG